MLRFLRHGRRGSSEKQNGLRGGWESRGQYIPLRCKETVREGPAGENKGPPSSGVSRSGLPCSWWADASASETRTNLATRVSSPNVTNHLGWPMADVFVFHLMVPRVAPPISYLPHKFKIIIYIYISVIVFNLVNIFIN